MFSKKEKPEIKGGNIGPEYSVVKEPKEKQRKLDDDYWEKIMKLFYILFLILMFFVFSYIYSNT